MNDAAAAETAAKTAIIDGVRGALAAAQTQIVPGTDPMNDDRDDLILSVLRAMHRLGIALAWRDRIATEPWENDLTPHTVAQMTDALRRAHPEIRAAFLTDASEGSEAGASYLRAFGFFEGWDEQYLPLALAYATAKAVA